MFSKKQILIRGGRRAQDLKSREKSWQIWKNEDSSASFHFYPTQDLHSSVLFLYIFQKFSSASQSVVPQQTLSKSHESSALDTQIIKYSKELENLHVINCHHYHSHKPSTLLAHPLKIRILPTMYVPVTLLGAKDTLK